MVYSGDTSSFQALMKIDAGKKQNEQLVLGSG